MHELAAEIARPIQRDSELAKADRSRAFRWEPVIYLYCLYIGIIWIGEVMHVNGASSIGAALLLTFLYVKYWRFLFSLKLDLMLFCIILCLVLPVIPLVSFDEKMIVKAYQELIKYYALIFVVLVGLSLPLTPVTRARRAWLLYIVILSFLLSGLMLAPLQISSPDVYTTSERVKGFLVNGNSFALVAMMLLFLIDEDRSGKLIMGLTHAIVLFLIYSSHTSGAFLGYVIGMLYRFIYKKRKFSLIAKLLVVAAGLVLAALIFVSIPPHTFKSVDLTNEKIEVAWDALQSLLSGRQIDYYGIIERKGQDVTSGAWRIYHWNNILQKFSDASLDKIFFGHGIGTMDGVFGLKAHNDYLRFLFQTGVFGLLLNLLIWGGLYRRMEVKYRWVVVMVAVFCISENNYDNFPAMSMLALYMLGARQRAESEISVSKKNAQQ